LTRSHSFEPVVDARTRVLILGSLPGVRSLERSEYYAHPQNGFWRLTGAVVGLDLTALPYAERLATLNAAGIGLWDVVASAERPGSLDSAIRNADANDLGALLSGFPGIAAVAFNGQTAATLARRQSLDTGTRARLVLPSSSAAHAVPWQAKLDKWLALRAWL